MTSAFSTKSGSDTHLRVDLVYPPALYYALAHNRVPIMSHLAVTNLTTDVLRDVMITVELVGPDGPLAPLWTRHVASLVSGDQVGWDEFDDLCPDVAQFKNADEAFAVDYRVTATTHDGPELRFVAPSRVLAHNEWFNSPALFDSIAAFVQPNARAVTQVLRSAAGILSRSTGSSSIEGYQAGSRRAVEIGGAVYEALRAHEIIYASAASFEQAGQKVRTTAEVLADHLGNCIDLSVTYAACLEAAGLHPLIWILDGHAVAGFFVTEERLPQIMATEPALMINLVESRRAIAVELTDIGPGAHPARFVEAAQLGEAALRGDRNLLGLVDIHLAHRSDIKPLPSTEVTAQPAEPLGMATPEPTLADLDKLGVIDEEQNLELEAADDDAPRRIAAWRRSLLDLSLRNPLLKLPKRGKGVSLHVPPGSLPGLDDLIHAGKAVRVVAQDVIAGVHVLQGITRVQELPDEVIAEELTRDRRIYADVAQTAYVSRMRGLQRDARTLLQETGSNYLYLTLGSLVHPTPTGEAHAPLFLVPVRIEGGAGQQSYTVLIDGDEIATPNYCLVQWLRVKHGVRIAPLERPMTDDNGIDIEATFRAIRTELVDSRLPYRIDESASLRLLQFSTFQMWRDLNSHWRSFMANEVVRHLVEKAGTPLVDEPPRVVVDEASLFLPIAADGSQMRAIELARHGHSFVLEGPPGTGKSQTITNLIAHAIRAGQTVLFVAEKQAALDVVKRRLAEVGLALFCLDLHGRKQTQRSIWQQLRAAHEHRVTADWHGWEALESRQRSRIASLTRYPEQVHTANHQGFSAWSAYQAGLAYGKGPCATIPADYFTVPHDVRLAVEQAVRDLPAAARSAQLRPEHPWRICGRRDVGDLRAHELQRAAENLEQARTLLHAMAEPLRAAITQLPRPWLLAETLAVAGLAADGHMPSLEHTVQAMRPGFDEQIHAAHSAVAALHRERGATLSVFHPSLFQAPGIDELSELANAAGRGLFGKKARRTALAGALRRHLVAQFHLDESNALSTFQAIVATRQQATVVAEQAQAAGLRALFPADWWPAAPYASRAIEATHHALIASRALYSRWPGLWSALAALGRHTPAADLARLADAWRRWPSLLQTTDVEFGAWSAALGWPAAWDRDGARWLGDLSSGPRPVQRWSALLALTDTVAGAGLTQFRDQVLRGELPADEIEVAFQRGRARSALVERLHAEALEHFDAGLHESGVADYLTTSREMRRELPRQLAAGLVADRKSRVNRFDARAGELVRRLNSRRDRLPFREACAQHPDVIAALTPCFLTSPVSVANFLEPGGLTFDLVIFDEASQIRVAQAVGAMGRGRSVVVVGDSRQMPPTSVMQAANTDEAEDTTVPEDLDSILTECVESGLPREWLTWHYRSTDEALIAFSNAHYYESKLASFPTPGGDETTGISWRRVDGHFDRGTRASRTNPIEAKAVVSEIVQLLSDPRTARHSIGVVTFNVQQRDLLLNLLEESQEPRVQDALARRNEALFVKNLENVQGDERDIVLFSLAFSPNPETGQLPLNFGPLAQEGGERRLNVAITRARRRVILFSSFDPAHIDLTRTRAVGTRHLRAYLELAARGLRASGDVTAGRIADSDRVVAEVAAALRSRGLEVATDFGLSHFTVDLVVRAGGEARWQVAVLLDGPEWARRPTVADRDAAPALLESMMRWHRVVRVWLPQWITDQDQVLDSIEKAAAASAVPDPIAEAADASEPTEERAEDFAVGDEDAEEPVEPLATPGVVQAPVAPVTAVPAPVASPRIESDGRQRSVVTPFIPYRPEIIGTREQIDRLAIDRDVQAIVRGRLARVIAAEGPIELDRLLRLVHKEFELHKVHSDRKDRMTRCLPKDYQITFGDGRRFVWPHDIDPDTWREVRQSQTPTDRLFHEVPREEIANALSWAFEHDRALASDQLVRTAMELLGFHRKTDAIDGIIHRTLTWAMTAGRLPHQVTPDASRPPEPPISPATSTAAVDFERAMRSVYDRAKNEAGYNATVYLRMLAEFGGLATAKKLLASPTISQGFSTLWERERLDLTVEALVVQPRFAELFTDDEIDMARKRLADFRRRQ